MSAVCNYVIYSSVAMSRSAVGNDVSHSNAAMGNYAVGNEIARLGMILRARV